MTPNPRAQDKTATSLFFPNLNGLRFIAALLVIIHHIEQVKYLFHYPNAWDHPAVQIIGKLGVVMFFVLSGFLITFLLLEEERLAGAISISRFYVRRILRIWPLYYLVVLVSLWVFPHIGYLKLARFSGFLQDQFSTKAMLFLLILPNLALALYPAVPFLSQAWSVGTEEQFYLLWPWVMRRARNRRVLLFLSVIVGYLVIRKTLAVVSGQVPSSRPLAVANGFWGMFNIDCMAIGAIVAYCAFHQVKPVMRVLTHRLTEIAAICTAAVCMGIGLEFPVYHYGFYAILFAITILNAALNPRTVVKLENPVLRYLGKVSYGLYMYHVLAIVIVVRVTHQSGYDSYPIVLIGSVGLAALIASISYEFIESRFLKFKARFSRIVSGDAVGRNAARVTH